MAATGRADSARGFTLIEVMIAVALIGILVAIALPSYNAYRERARNRNAAADIVAMGAQIKARFEDERAYPADLAAAKLQGRKDPWGRSYVYYNIAANGKGGARKDKALNPINSDFDLYSLGPDGVSKSQVSQKDSVDDIIRAHNGAFVGRASDF
ncbi:type IV pilin protein [Piscinibacter sakaiensis]|uniref:type IV pilin protein n=1 Tax=Piscinibacter sakaiensis TaxID=1547922 RepID=UPI003AAEC000